MAVEKLKDRIKTNSSRNSLELYLNPSPPMKEIRDYLEKFKGGSVKLNLGTDGIATITLSHVEKRNAVSGKMMGDFMDVVDTLETWREGKAVVIKGEGGNFCSGGDLDLARGTGNPDGAFQMATFMNNLLDKLQTLPLITVALIEGCGALGGGSEISIACDYRVIASSCQGIGFVHGRMAIVPAWGGTRRLVGAVGYGNALTILTAAQVYRPEDALKLGLVDEITPKEQDPYDFTLQWLKNRTRHSPTIIKAMKTTALLAKGDSDSRELEMRIFAPLWGGPENKAALASNIKHKAR